MHRHKRSPEHKGSPKKEKSGPSNAREGLSATRRASLVVRSQREWGRVVPIVLEARQKLKGFVALDGDKLREYGAFMDPGYINYDLGQGEGIGFLLRVASYDVEVGLELAQDSHAL